MKYNIPRPDGVFPYTARLWGGGRSAPPPPKKTPYYFPNYWTIINPKTTLDNPGLDHSEYVAKFYLNVTDDVTGRIKGQILIICHCRLLRVK